MSWQRDAGDGVCRRKAPQPGIVVTAKRAPGQKPKDDYILVWPRTNPEEWCMQFIEYIGSVEKKS